MVTALVLVMGTFAGCKKEDKEKSKGTTENVRVLNYFRESDGFAQPENMYYDNIYSVDGNLVYAGYMYSSGAGENKAGIYDTLTDEIREIDIRYTKKYPTPKRYGIFLYIFDYPRTTVISFVSLSISALM